MDLQALDASFFPAPARPSREEPREDSGRLFTTELDQAMRLRRRPADVAGDAPRSDERAPPEPTPRRVDPKEHRPRSQAESATRQSRREERPAATERPERPQASDTTAEDQATDAPAVEIALDEPTQADTGPIVATSPDPANASEPAADVPSAIVAQTVAAGVVEGSEPVVTDIAPIAQAAGPAIEPMATAPAPETAPTAPAAAAPPVALATPAAAVPSAPAPTVATESAAADASAPVAPPTAAQPTTAPTAPAASTAQAPAEAAAPAPAAPSTDTAAGITGAETADAGIRIAAAPTPTAPPASPIAEAAPTVVAAIATPATATLAPIRPTAEPGPAAPAASAPVTGAPAPTATVTAAAVQPTAQPTAASSQPQTSVPTADSAPAPAVTAAASFADALADAAEGKVDIVIEKPSADTSNLAQAGADRRAQVEQAVRAEPAQPARQNLPPPPVADQIAVRIAKQTQGGEGRISLQLRPETLGIVDVDIEVRRDGTMKAVISVEKPETLEWLRRDAQHLERALQDVGVKTDSGSLNFALREQRQDGSGAFARSGPRRGQGFGRDDDAADGKIAEARMAEAAARRVARGGVDVRI